MTVRLFKIVFVSAAACSAVLFAGCVPMQEEVVAAVDGEYKITAGDVKFYYGRGAAAGEWPAGEAVEERVDSIIEAAVLGKILEIEAEERGYDQDPDVKFQIEIARDQKLMDVMFARIEASVPVTEAEVLDYYEKGRNRRMYSFIATESPERAKEAFEALQAGMPWDQAVAEFSTFKGYTGPGGQWDCPMEYMGDEISEAVWVLDVGEYTPPVGVEGAFGWNIYRYDKEVHGSGQGFAEAAPDIKLFLTRRKTHKRFLELARGWRKSVPVIRNEELWREIQEKPCEELWTSYRDRDLVLSTVADIPIYYDKVLDLVQNFFVVPPAEVEEVRKNNPARYEGIWESRLRELEDLALMRYQARREGVDKLPSFRREMAARRTELLVDALYQKDFASTIPAPTEEEVKAYFEEHRGVFYNPESVEVYLVAMPDRGELERFYEEIKAGADLVITGEARNRAREKKEQEMTELPASVPPEQREWLGVVAISSDPNLLNALPDGPFAAELRPRVYPFGELNVLSSIFRLRDGRWAFYEPIFHAPGTQYDLSNAETLYRCRTEVFSAKVRSPETTAAADAWLASLRALHAVTVDKAAAARGAAGL